MSTCEPSAGDPYPLSHSYDPNPPELHHIAADGHHIPPDPLLESGAFIDFDLDSSGPTLAGSKEAQNGISEHHVQPSQHGAGEPVSDEPELLARPVADESNCTETSATDGAESTPSGRKAQLPGAAVDFLPERPKWLPEGWSMDCRIRSSGASAGSIDRYYFDPVSGRRFRSKKEVDYFLETGSTRKRKRDADNNSIENSGGRKSSAAPLNFDFNDVPEKVRWVLTNASRDQWTPFVGEKMVPKSTRKEWNAAFHFSCS